LSIEFRDTKVAKGDKVDKIERVVYTNACQRKRGANLDRAVLCVIIYALPA